MAFMQYQCLHIILTTRTETRRVVQGGLVKGEISKGEINKGEIGERVSKGYVRGK